MSDGIIGTVPCELIGGPLDGTRYGDLPDSGESWESATLRIPTGQPAELHPRLVYVCTDPRPVPVPELGLALLHFHWVGVEEPDAAECAAEPIDAPALAVAPAGTQVSW